MPTELNARERSYEERWDEIERRTTVRWAEMSLQIEELLCSPVPEAYPDAPWSPENEAARLNELKTSLDAILEEFQNLIHAVELGCSTCKGMNLALVVHNIRRFCAGFASYARYLQPEIVVVFDRPEYQDEKHRAESRSRAEAMLNEAMLQLHPSVPWSPKNEAARLGELKTDLENTVKDFRALIHTVKHGCPVCNGKTCSWVLQNTRYFCGRVASYAKYLLPEAVIKFDHPE